MLKTVGKIRWWLIDLINLVSRQGVRATVTRVPVHDCVFDPDDVCMFQFATNERNPHWEQCGLRRDELAWFGLESLTAEESAQLAAWEDAQLNDNVAMFGHGHGD